MSAHLRSVLAWVLTIWALSAASADDVQRQIQQRENQQMELQLRMQQQMDRASQPPQSPAAGLRQRQLERDQQQRLQQSHDREMRGTIAPAPEGAPQQGEIERRRASQAAGDQLNRFGMERKTEP